MKHIAVLVSGGGTNLQALIDAQGGGEIVNGSITAVISSSPEAYALERAKQAGIPGYVLARQDYPSNRAMTVALVDKLRQLDIQLVVLAGFMTILTEEMVLAFPNAILNIHPALIPSFAGPGCYGLHVHEKALAYGVKLSGATVHFVSPECDGGPIVLQKAVEVLPDDTPEVLQRRMQRYLDGDEHFSPLPDLLLMDGGHLQAQATQQQLESMGIHIPILGMVKDDRHRTRALVTPEGRELGIQQSPPLFALVGRVQEEVHRFAIAYHHEKHSRSAMTSRLDGIPGIGDVRKKALLKHFKSVKAISEAELVQLEALLPKAAARAVYDHFHEKNT